MNTKFFFIVIIFLNYSVITVSQIMPVVKTGILHASWKGEAKEAILSVVDETNGVVSSSGRTGFYMGAGIDLPLGDFLSVEPSLQYSQKGYGLKGNITINDLKIDALKARGTSQMHSIDLPVLLKVKPTHGLTIFAGPQVSYLIKNNLRADVGILGFSIVNTKLDITEQFNRWDAGITGGVGYEFENGLGVNASYERGFNRLDQNQRFKVFHEGFRAGLTFRIK